MSVLSALAARHTTLTAGAIDHLHRLLGEWQVLADLAFADLLLFAPVRGASRFIVLGQVRPYPAQTLYQEDMVGVVVDSRDRPRVAQAIGEARIVREGDPEWREGVPVREETIPVLYRGEVVAVVAIEQNLAAARTPSHLELSYLRAAAALEQMIADGVFPFHAEEQVDRELSPRVGDGFLEIDEAGRIAYASPNAISAYRRLGVTTNVVGSSLQDIGFGHRRVQSRMNEERPLEDEIEAGGAFILRRFIPLLAGGKRTGAVGLVRDVTESRKRDRLLSIKDATIREIHHRVKNNLQTVASLLRLQSRRLKNPEARAELEESVRRISSIALVHETLSQESGLDVSFDLITGRILEMAKGSLTRPDRPISFNVVGTAGDLSSDIATPMSLILTELVQNAVEHAFPGAGGAITVNLGREDGSVVLTVADDGVGVPPEFDIETTSSLGLQIVRTLANDLGGSVVIANEEQGASATVRIPLVEE